MSDELKKLFSPYKMKNIVFKNRLVRSPMESSLGVLDGSVTEDHLRMYRTAAEGGVGLLITEAVGVHLMCRFTNHQIAAWDDDCIPGLKKLADVIHAHGDGVVLWSQLHAGGAADWGYSYGQNDNKFDLNNINDETIEIIIEAFGQAALRLKKAGFDGVELHGGHGYLIAQFISPAVNHRTDKWGGSPENRMNFPLALYKSIREKVGEDFPIGIKMNTADFLPGGNWLDETSRIARKFAEVGFDYIEASGGMGFMTELREGLRKHMGEKEYYFRDAIPKFREAVKGTNTALCVTGGIGSPLVMEEILGEGVDFIGLARPWLSEPDFANRVKAGDLRRTRCVSREKLCNLCLTRLALGPVTCYKFYPGYCKMQCPIGQDVPGYNALIARGQFDEALALIKKDNPLPGVLSRVCTHTCETVCRGQTGEPLANRDLKRFVIDYGMKKGLMTKAVRRVSNERGKVAIIGSGPAGLSCGLNLAQRGYRPTVFEKQPIKGGTLSTGIPRYRLPEEILKADIEYVESAGVEIKTGTALGKDFLLSDLFSQGYKAVFLAMGASVPVEVNVDGCNLEGVYSGLDFLRKVNLERTASIGKRVLVIGGGNVAVDAAMTAVRLGAKETHLVCLESRQEMPAFRWEVDDALEEGVVLHNGWGIKRINGNGKVSGVDTIRCSKIFDEQGQFNPQYDETGQNSFDVDTVILAIGQKTDLACLSDEYQNKIVQRGVIKVNEVTLETEIPGVLAGGDVATGPKSVVEAVKAGKDAAESIDRFIRGASLARTPKDDSYVPFFKDGHPDADASEHILKENSLRQVAPKRSPLERKADFKEIFGVLSEEQAVEEAKRCLKYDLDLEEKSAARKGNMGKAEFVLKRVTGEDW